MLAFGAASQVSDLLLIIVGDLPEFVSLKNLMNELQLNSLVTFTDFMRRPTDFLAQLEVFACISDNAHITIAMLEAMVPRFSNVATQVGNLPSIFANVAHSYIAKMIMLILLRPYFAVS